MIKKIQPVLIKLRKTKPLILNLSNYVTMDFVANVLLALGAAPIMTVCDEELEELVKISNCITINIGTLDAAFINRCHKTVTLAKQYRKPIVLDPVGSGATLIRTHTAQTLIQQADIVKGNASEILSLSDKDHQTKGVESVHSTLEARGIAMQLSQQYGFTTVVSGAIDFVTDGKEQAEIPYGSPLMSRVTGMGCALAAVIAAFRSVVDNSFESAALATQYYGLCGQAAEKLAQSPGAFRMTFIDELAT